MISEGVSSPLTGIPMQVKDVMCTEGVRNHLRIANVGGLRSRLHRHGSRAAVPAGSGHAGQGEHGRIRHGLLLRELGFSSHPEPMGHQPGSRRK